VTQGPSTATVQAAPRMPSGASTTRQSTHRIKVGSRHEKKKMRQSPELSMLHRASTPCPAQLTCGVITPEGDWYRRSPQFSTAAVQYSCCLACARLKWLRCTCYENDMNKIKQFWSWLFNVSDTQRSAFDVVLWWELRRIPYNLIIGSVGFISLIIFFLSIISTGVLGPGEDAVEPLAIIFAPIAINIFYCAGWVVENILRFIWPSRQYWFGPFLFKLGLGFSLFCVTFPAVFWLGYRLLQLCNIIK